MGTALKVIDISPDLDSIEADRMLIEQTASYVKGLWQQVNAADMYVTAGREFKKLHGHLSKTKARDKDRIGWVRAFDKTENKFGCTRQTAKSYIAIYDAFFHTANAFAVWRLPQSLRALHALAKLKLTADQLKAASADGILKPDSTEGDIRRIAQQSGAAPASKKQKATKVQPVPLMPAKNAPKKQRVEAAFEMLAKLGLTIDDLAGEFVR